MSRYLLRRLPSALLVLFLASILIFLVIRLVPGDPATALAGADATDESIAAIRSSLGLDQLLPAQYLHWIGGVLTLDFGRSYLIGGQIDDLVAHGLVNTVVLTGAALILSILLSVVLAVWWVTSRRRWVDALLTGINTVTLAVPTFVTGVVLVLLLAIALPVLPAGGVPPDGFLARPDIALQYLLLPAFVLALPTSAALTRFLAESLRTELAKPYILTARAAGVSRRRLVLRHGLRCALPTYLTALGLQAGNLLGGAVLVEAVFNWPGLGQLVAQAIGRRDYPVVQVLLMLAVAVFIAIQVITDLVHALLDPRVRIGGLT